MISIADLEKELNDNRNRAEAILAAIERSGRTPSASERTSIEGLTQDCKGLKATIDRAKNDADITAAIHNLTRGLPPRVTRVADGSSVEYLAGVPTTNASLGQQFVDTFGEFFRRGGHRASSWRTPAAELYVPGVYGATLTTVAGGGGSLIVPQDRGLIAAPSVGPLGVADLMGSGADTVSNAITYLVEQTYIVGADTVAEGAAKPESTLTFTPRTDPVRKVAPWLPVTEEMLEDEGQMRSYIDSRLRVGVTLVEDDQLLNGSGIAPDVEGFRNRTGLAAAVARDTASGESNADAVARQISALRVATSMDPDGIVMNPLQWSAIEISKTEGGDYLAGGPFATLPVRRLWGVPVALSSAMPAGRALVGAFNTGAALFRKGGIRVEASNSHSDFFIKNLVAIRAETRVALAVYRRSAFGEVTGLG